VFWRIWYAPLGDKHVVGIKFLALEGRLANYISSETRIEHTLYCIHKTPDLCDVHLSDNLIKVAKCLSLCSLSSLFVPLYS
jgi:hypothetical protein